MKSQNGVGAVVNYYPLLNYIEFVSSEGFLVKGYYYTICEPGKWFQNPKTKRWYIPAELLPVIEAKISANE